MVMTIDRASDGKGFRVPGGKDLTVTDVSKRVQGQKTSAKIAAQMQIDLQAEIDVRVPRSTLPSDEETKDTDPARPNEFWDGTDIVTRTDIVTVTPQGDSYLLSIRVA